MNNKTKTVLMSLVMISALSVSVANAEEAKPVAEPIMGSFGPELPKAGVNCFDYYKFQSVQVSLGTEKDVYSAGDEITFKGNLINQNAYPVVDGNVFVRVSEKNPNYRDEGFFIIDEFISLFDINLDANESKPVEVKWKAPAGLKKGDYRADFFFSVGKKFNLGGLPFTNEIIVGFSEFQINSENAGTIAFDKSGTTVNGKKYYHIGTPPRIEPNGKVEVVQPIKNTTKESKVVEVTYDLYFWDGVNEKDKISSKKETVSIDPGKSVSLDYAIESMKDSVYMLKITAVSGDLKSMVNIRPVSDQAHARLNYPAITKFPLQKGDDATLFSCFHNSSNINTKGKVILTLSDRSGKQVEKMEYSGDIWSAMMAEKKDFKANDDYDYLKLKAQLLDEGGKQIEEYESIYDCSKLNSKSCQALLAEKPAVTPGITSTSSAKKIILVVFILILLGAIGFAVARAVRKK